MSRFIDDHVAGAISKAELPLVEIGTAMVTARPSETTSVEYGVRHKVLLYSRGYQQVGALLAPRADSVASRGISTRAGDDRMEKLLLTVREAADVLGVSRSRVYELLSAEQLDSVKIGRSRRVALASVRRLAEGPSAS